jgi:hypothetical protein
MLGIFNIKEAKAPKRFGKIARLIQYSFLMEIEKANKNSETITIEISTEPYDKLHSFQREIEKKYVVIVNRKTYNLGQKV